MTRSATYRFQGQKFFSEEFILCRYISFFSDRLNVDRSWDMIDQSFNEIPYTKTAETELCWQFILLPSFCCIDRGQENKSRCDIINCARYISWNIIKRSHSIRWIVYWQYIPIDKLIWWAIRNFHWYHQICSGLGQISEQRRPLGICPYS